METILPAFIVIILLLYAVLTPAQSYLNAQDQLQGSRQLLEQRWSEQARTDLTVLRTQISDDGVTEDVTVRNTGQTKLADFDQWDLILQYYDRGAGYHIVRLPLAEGNQPELNTWSAASIAQDLYDPGIFNPGETLTVRFKLSPAVGYETANRVDLTAPSGVGVTALFIGPPFPPTPTPTP